MCSKERMPYNGIRKQFIHWSGSGYLGVRIPATLLARNNGRK